MVDSFIHVKDTREAGGSRVVDISLWEQGEWTEDLTGQKRRILIRPDKFKIEDYYSEGGKHELREYREPNKGEVKWAAPVKEAKIEKKESPEKELYEYMKAMGMEFCNDQFGNDVAIYENRYYLLNGKELKAIVSEKYFEEKDRVFTDSIWTKVQQVTTRKCSLNTKFFPLRCHTEEFRTYYDDGESVWEFECGQHTIYKRDSTDCPVIFRRYNHQLKAEIQPNEDKTEDLLKSITAMFTIDDYREESVPPLFLSNHPNPINLFTGDPGAAKSTFTQFLKNLVDPDQVEKLKLPNKKEMADFAMHKQQFYLILYDNVRDFYEEQSDELCRMVTGSTSVTRKLYTDGELYLSKGLPRIVMNGLRPEPSNFNDLLDRTQLIDMRRIEKSRPEREVWRKINLILPKLRYCCLRDASKALCSEIEESKELPRMSEYCLLGENVSRVWGKDNDYFIDWFTNRMNISHASGMDDPMMIVLQGYLKMYAFMPDGLKHTASDWRIKLIEWATEKMPVSGFDGIEKQGTIPLRKGMAMLVEEKDFPKNANWMGRRFRDLAPLLGSLGYGIEVIRSTEDRTVRIFKKGI